MALTEALDLWARGKDTRSPGCSKDQMTRPVERIPDHLAYDKESLLIYPAGNSKFYLMCIHYFFIIPLDLGFLCEAICLTFMTSDAFEIDLSWSGVPWIQSLSSEH